jgi:hypothetical protein
MNPLSKRTMLLAALMTACGTPGPAPIEETAQGLATPPIRLPTYNTPGAPEPEIAVGKDFIFANSSSSFEVYRRGPTGSISDASTPYKSSSLAAALYNGKGILQQLNGLIDYSGTQISPCPNDQQDIAQVDKNATDANTGCLGAPYDGDVIYDQSRDRFWMMTQLRNMVYPCDSDGDTINDGYQTQAWKNEAKAMGTTAKCVHDWNFQNYLHRYMAVSVTKTGEDPGNGWYTYVLVEESGDWPQMMVHGDYLLLNHRDMAQSGRVWVFSADSLANNTGGYANVNINGTVSTTGKVLKEINWLYANDDFNTSAVNWDVGGTERDSVTLTTSMFFIKQPYSTDGDTFMVGGMNSHLVFYALPPMTQPPGGTVKPQLLLPGMVSAGATVPEDVHPFNRGNFVPGALQNGLFYWAWPACNGGAYDSPSGTVTCSDVNGTPLRVFVRAVRVPLTTTTWNGQAAVKSSITSADYLVTAIGENDSNNDEYALPVVGVNQNNDWLVEYSRYPFIVPGTTAQIPDVRYQVMFHDQNSFNSSQRFALATNMWLRSSTASQDPSTPQLPGRGGSIDIPSVVADPLSPSQLWMSYGIPTASNTYQGIFTGLDIGACANDKDYNDQFRPGMVGCGGHLAWTDSPSSLCGPGYHLCSAAEWGAYTLLNTPASPAHLPTQDYWTADHLDRSGTGSLQCRAVEVGTAGAHSCGSSPMHICTELNSGTDSFGNTCQWVGCGYDEANFDLSYGGCQSGDKAGALCCAN